MSNLTNENDVPLEVQAAFRNGMRIGEARAAEALTSALHPEFGTEWREPDGMIWKAVQEAKKQAWAEGWRAFSRGISEKGNPYE